MPTGAGRLLDFLSLLLTPMGAPDRARTCIKSGS